MVSLDKAMANSYKLSIVTMSLSAVVCSQFATQVFGSGVGSLCYIGCYVKGNK